MACDDDPATSASGDPRLGRAELSPSGPFPPRSRNPGAARPKVATFRRTRASLRELPELERAQGFGGGQVTGRKRKRLRASSLVFGAFFLPVVLFSVGVGVREARQEKLIDPAPIAAFDPQRPDRTDEPGGRSAQGVEKGPASARVIAAPIPEPEDAPTAGIRIDRSVSADRSDPPPDQQLAELLAAQPQLSETERYILQDMAAADALSASSEGLKIAPRVGQISAAPSATNSGLVTLEPRLPAPSIRRASFPRSDRPEAPDPSSSIYSVQLSSVPSEAAAQRASASLGRDLAQVLQGLPMTIERAELAGGPVFRVRAGTFIRRAGAEDLCRQIREHEADCYVLQRSARSVPPAD